MSATVHSRHEDLAGVLARKSALSRRRVRAFYLIAADKLERIHFLIVVAALAVIALIVVITWPAKNFPPARDRSRSLRLPTASSHLDRFVILHIVQHRDTISGLARYYYGSGSGANQRRLLDANPGLPKDLRQLTVDTTVKVPLT